MTKRALLIGINAYPAPFTALRGCLNDIQQYKSILQERYGFESTSVRTLEDKEATRANILLQLDWLIENAQAGDVLVFTYSGHGSQVDDDSDDEWECRDEILIPYDHCWDNPLRDDDLKRRFERVPTGANLTFISDSCHSGTMNKLATETAVPRVVLVPAEIQARIAVKVAHRNTAYRDFAMAEYRSLSKDLKHVELEARMDKFLSETLDSFKQNRFRFVNTHDNNVLLAACQDDQTSTDAFIENSWHGAFTFHLHRVLVQAPETLTYAQLIEEASKGLVNFQQTLQLECPEALKALPVFGALPAIP